MVTTIEPVVTFVVPPVTTTEPALRTPTVPTVSRSPIVPVETTIVPLVTRTVPNVTTIEPPSTRPTVPETISTSTSPAVLVFTGNGVNWSAIFYLQQKRWLRATLVL